MDDEYEYVKRSSGESIPPHHDGLYGRMGPVFCSKCSSSQVIDTIACLRQNSWPVCCGKSMSVEKISKHPHGPWKKRKKTKPPTVRDENA